VPDSRDRPEAAHRGADDRFLIIRGRRDGAADPSDGHDEVRFILWVERSPFSPASPHRG
jgi:hypothetical protein